MTRAREESKFWTIEDRPIVTPDDFREFDPWEASRVSNWMDGLPVKHGKWLLTDFQVSERDSMLDALRSEIVRGKSKHRIGANLPLRHVPPGNYTTLKRKARLEECEEHDVPEKHRSRFYVPIMSDTPDELEGHRHVVEEGHGRVLVHGLGLGCVTAALLAKDDVEHVDVVDSDPEVVELMRDYYEGDRCTIHIGNCATYAWPKDAHWSYVWHDIWSTITDQNLTNDTAEYGIGYEYLFSRFEDRADMQGAWAYDEAIVMRDVKAKEWQWAEEWAERFNNGTLDERVDMVLRQQTISGLEPVGEDPPISIEDIRKLWAESGMLKQVTDWCASVKPGEITPTFVIVKIVENR